MSEQTRKKINQHHDNIQEMEAEITRMFADGGDASACVRNDVAQIEMQIEEEWRLIREIEKERRDIVCCPQCKGAGEVQLQDAFRGLADALSILRAEGPMTSTELHSKLTKQILPTAVNNRLEDLRRAGFVDRTKSGRQWIYKAIK